MAIKYLYIDDQPSDTEGIALGLSIKPRKLKVERPSMPENWDQQIKFLRDNRSKFDGLLLDLELRVRKNKNSLINYQSPALAQEVRNLIKEGLIDDLPIILCSTDINFKKLYDNTNQDLFDAIFEKDKMNGEAVIQEFIAYSETYKNITKTPTDLKQLLNSNDINISQIEQYYNALNTIHEKAALLKQVVQPAGILIDEDLLAIRLGVNKTKSEDWETLLKKFSSSKYKGVFSKAWQRWWMPAIYKWWDKKFPNLFFTNTSAAEKVDALKKKFKIKKLTCLSLPKYHEYNSFWDRCAESGIHMVSADGLRTKDIPKFDWQDISYLSNNFIKNVTLVQQKELRNKIYHLHKNSLEEILNNKNKSN